MKKSTPVGKRNLRQQPAPARKAPAASRTRTLLMTAGKNRSERLRTSEQRYRELKQQLQDVGFVCVGSLQTRYLPCGNPSCRCHQDPAKRHGPYHYWTRKVKGRTVTVLLKQEQVPRYREWIQNNRRLEDLVQEMRRISAQVLRVEADGLHS
jgi:Family of unknown function (DUF6788)